VRVAFYAPLKAPDHPVPSGDRRVAQLLFAALRQAGHEPVLASRLRSWDGSGNGRRQQRLAGLGAAAAGRFLRRCRAQPETTPEAWFTYHLYHKAPDWLGPAVADALDIPYVVAEASWAPKQAGGSWDLGHRAAERAIRRADAVVGLNPDDQECVLPLLAQPSRWIQMRPFLDAGSFRHPRTAGAGPPRLIAIGMMRPGDKLASYRLLGEALSRLLHLPWSLAVVGDGPARPEVAAALAPLGPRVAWLGALGPDAVRAQLAAADLCVWPAINEAYGMALLEAQASGLPVVAGASRGVAGVVVPDLTGLLVPVGDAAAFAAAVAGLLADPGRRAALGAAAAANVAARHDIAGAARILDSVLCRLAPACAA
jgi:glycosyltransferase involved in cell wall biosynthesis